MHEGKGKAYDKREKGKAGAVKGKRERPQTKNLIRDPTRHPDRAHARTTRNDFPVRGGLPKGELTPPNLRYMKREGERSDICGCIYILVSYGNNYTRKPWA